MRIIILQYGDYGDVYRRLQSGGRETFRDQRHTVNYVASLVADHEVTTIAICNRPHDEELVPGLRSIGVSSDLVPHRRRFWALLDRFNPQAFICRTPNRVALAWAASNRVPTLPVFADTFTNVGWRNRLNNWRLKRILGQCRKPCVANHSLSASQSLRHIGLSPDQIVPWEHLRMQPIGEAKDAPLPDRPFRLFFVGSLIESKGVGDCIEAVAVARAAHHPVELTIAGSGDTDRWAAFARQHGVETSVRLLGVIPSERVVTEMRDHDAVIVAPRHQYPEGLPNALYEAMSSRSPLIASDHPAFVKRLRPSEDSLIFPAGQPRELAGQVERLIQEPELYARLSRESAETLASLYVGIEWTELITRFINDPVGSSGWAKGLTLAAGPYIRAEKSYRSDPLVV
jgi:glycosyltransferase involved in cell wall biosynthesis